MGRHYATHFGASPAIATAIEEHWWPKGQGAALPTTDTGAILALADRMDTIVGAFAVGLEPSGSADPFGLRRAAIGIWQILLARGARGANPSPDANRQSSWAHLFPDLFEASANALGQQGVKLPQDAERRLGEFFRGRLRGILVDGGLPTQDVDAALAQSYENPVDARARATSLGRVPKEARAVFKRIANIIDDAKAKGISVSLSVSPNLFVSETETSLWDEWRKSQDTVYSAIAQLRYADAFEELVRLQPTVAAFFDKGGVMVMDPDPALRDNRLGLLRNVLDRFMDIADFRLLGGAA
jgi:glycyl-tRNA synthetase beta chain